MTDLASRIADARKKAAEAKAIGFAVLMHTEADLIIEMADEIDRLTAQLEKAREALAAGESWVDRWTAHVGRCKGGAECTCGRTAILFELATAARVHAELAKKEKE